MAEEVELLLSLLERLETKEYFKLLFRFIRRRENQLHKTRRVGRKITEKYLPTSLKEAPYEVRIRLLTINSYLT